MPIHHSLHYLECPSTDLPATRRFFETVFNWSFVDYGPQYIAFTDLTLEGGFFASEHVSRTNQGAALAIFFSEDLVASQAQVEAAGGEILQPIFDFPGGRRFHFCEPSGTEFAIWSDR